MVVTHVVVKDVVVKHVVVKHTVVTHVVVKHDHGPDGERKEGRGHGYQREEPKVSKLAMHTA